MKLLISQFDLRDGCDKGSFEAAWAALGQALSSAGYRAELSAVFDRQTESGFDTDETRAHRYMTTLQFATPEDADRAWQAIEACHPSIAVAHLAMLRMTKDAIFTFWNTA